MGITWTCSMDMQPEHAPRMSSTDLRHRLAAWTCRVRTSICSIEMKMQHGCGHAARIWIHHGHGYAARAQISSIDLEERHGYAA
jgi:hypothetical protein